MPTILITGGTGLIGSHLRKVLEAKGHRTLILSRTGSNHTVHWNPDKGTIDSRAIEAADVVINLAGANIGDKHWSRSYKQRILDSRTQGAALLARKFAERERPLQAFISMSAVGYYGARTVDTIFTEQDPPANDFLAEVCQAWEASATPFIKKGIRTVIFRAGVVFSMTGGALPSIVRPVRFFAGAPIGSGKQWIPWIHVDDLCDMFIMAIDNSSMTGTFNAVAPEHVSNEALTRSIASVIHRPTWPLNIPTLLMKIIFRERATLLLEGSRVDGSKVLDCGFAFRFPKVRPALCDLLSQ